MSREKQTKPFWAQLEQVQDNPEFEEFLSREYPVAKAEFSDGVSRRRWLQLMGASFALGAAGCRFDNEIIAPFARRPQNRTPGKNVKYATTMDVSGVARPLLVTSVDGRPIKVDGNPDHPDSGGGTDAFSQASILEFYDPFRSRTVIKNLGTERQASDWAEFAEAAALSMSAMAAAKGKGLCVLSEPTSSPSIKSLKAKFARKYPESKWFDFTSVGEDNSLAGTKLAFGKTYSVGLDLAKAKVIVAFDSDVIGDHPTSMKNQHGWAAGRDVDNGQINRMYAVESQMTMTGMNADNRLPLRSDQIGGFIASLQEEVDKRLASGNTDVDEATEKNEAEKKQKFLEAIAADLVANKGDALISVGRTQSPEVHARVAALNAKLGNIGNAVVMRETEEGPGSLESISALVEAINAGDVTTLVMLGGNPVYDAPRELKFKEALAKVDSTLHLSIYDNETSRVCNWHVNMAHPLEAWGDATGSDGSWCVGQPMILPLHDGRSTIEFLATLLGEEVTDGQTIVRQTAQSQIGAVDSDDAWNQVLHDGFVKDSADPGSDVTVTDFETTDLGNAWQSDTEIENGNLEVVFFPGSSVGDGRYANSSWLQELPDPITKVTWGNAALIGPKTAETLGLTRNTRVNLEVDGQSVEVTTYVLQGMAPGTVAIALGYGRTAAGHVGGDTDNDVDPVGDDVGPLRSADHWFHAGGASLESTGVYYQLAQTQDKYDDDKTGQAEIEARIGERQDLIRWGTFSQYEEFMAKLAEQGHGSGDDHPDDDHPDDDHPDDDHEANEDHRELDTDPAKILNEDEHAGHDTHNWPERHLHFANVDLNPGPPLEESPRWGMSIDLNKCIGCNGCVIGCQSENNIPVVGRDQVIRGREMHWLRMDRYFLGDDDDPRVAAQPMTCQQCEKAPCEQVCPVAATVHSSEGLNDMVYNRCIGTRYCGNNCPFKVRRFNYLNYSDATTFVKYPWDDKLSQANQQLQGLMANPDVTIRSRGVMEKCTYCVQRIQVAKIQASNEGRELAPNEITTACQDACPTSAIKFGDLSNKESDVAKAHASPRSYTQLEILNLYQRTQYLARVRNPHPALELELDRAPVVQHPGEHPDEHHETESPAGDESTEEVKA